MEAAAKVQRQMVRLRGRSYVAFVFTPTVPIPVSYTTLTLPTKA